MDEHARQADLWDRWAAHYDDDSRGHLPAAAQVLADLAGAGPALELGIGTGRLALPLAARGVRVVGVDASPEMTKRLLARRGGLPIEVHLGDMAEVNLTEQFRLVYAAASTFYLLLTQQRQVACLRSAARLLTPDGAIVIEAATPQTTATEPLAVRDLDDDHLKISIHQHDPIAQIVRSQEIRLDTHGHWRMLPAAKRYVHPTELDLMAQLAQLDLKSRWAGWERSAFTADSRRHISIYQPYTASSRSTS